MAAPHKTNVPTESATPRIKIASYATYPEAERGVDWLADQGYDVAQTAIVGRGLRSVEQVTERMTSGRAALLGAAEGGLVGALFALLFGVFFTGPDFGELLLYAVVMGGLLGALFGAVAHSIASGGRRDFLSTTRLEAERYDIEVDADAAVEAKQVLDAMPRGAGR
jgi:hypothetical protein